MGWISPTGFVDGGNVWSSEPSAYDEDTGVYAYTSITGVTWSDYLELTPDSAIDCDKVQVWSDRTGVKVNLIEVDVYYGDAWHNIYSGVLVVGSFQEYAIGSEQSVTAIRVRYHHNQSGKTKDARLAEADFNEVVGVVIVDGVAAGSGVGLAISVALLEVAGQAQGSGVGLSQSSAHLLILALASGQGAGLASAIASLIVLAQAQASGIGIAEALAELEITGQAYGEGIGIAEAMGERILLGQAQGSGVGLSQSSAHLLVLALASGQGVGMAEALAKLEIAGQAYGEGIGIAEAMGERFLPGQGQGGGKESISAQAIAGGFI